MDSFSDDIKLIQRESPDLLEEMDKRIKGFRRQHETMPEAYLRLFAEWRVWRGLALTMAFLYVAQLAAGLWLFGR